MPGVLSASHPEESSDDSRTGTDVASGVGNTRDDSNGRGLASFAGWQLASAAAPHLAGQRCPGVV